MIIVFFKLLQVSCPLSRSMESISVFVQKACISNNSENQQISQDDSRFKHSNRKS